MQDTRELEDMIYATATSCGAESVDFEQFNNDYDIAKISLNGHSIEILYAIMGDGVHMAVRDWAAGGAHARSIVENIENQIGKVNAWFSGNWEQFGYYDANIDIESDSFLNRNDGEVQEVLNRVFEEYTG